MSLPQESLDQLFTNAFTEHGFLDKAVSVEEVEKVIKDALMGPTAYNTSPMRLVIVSTPEAKEKLVSIVPDGNKQQTKEAPINIIVAVDTEFEDKLDFLMPVVPGASAFFKGDHHDAAMNLNGTLQAGYLIIALRAHGFNVGPEVTVPAVDEEFLKDTKWKSTFIINVGYGNPEKRYPRAPRFSIDQMAKKF